MIRLSLGKRKLLSFHGEYLKPFRVVRALEQREAMQRAKADAEEAKGSKKSKAPAVQQHAPKAPAVQPKAPAVQQSPAKAPAVQQLTEHAADSEITDRDD